uniref:dynactin-associated protein isoform X2 n=1 Tax=Callithrix jacchus TaxID=9483 RepID=UPI0023DD17D7|nr:dynactin-associated protein isoform X2 [Callithrix jacchus]
MLSQSQPVKDIKGNEQIEKYSWREACDIGSSRMDRKHGTYVLNVEHSVNQLPIPRPNDQEAHSSIRWCPPSNDITSDVSPNLAGVCVSPGVPAHSRCLQSESCNTQLWPCDLPASPSPSMIISQHRYF